MLALALLALSYVIWNKRPAGCPKKRIPNCHVIGENRQFEHQTADVMNAPWRTDPTIAPD